MSGDTLDLASEKVLLEVADAAQHVLPRGRRMVFDSDGNLYLATGDNTNPFESDGYTPIDERPGRQDYDAQRTSGNTNDLRGKVLRIHPEADGDVHGPGRQPVPAAAPRRPGPRSTRWASATRSGSASTRRPTRCYVADYGPDARPANPNRGPEGTRRVEHRRRSPATTAGRTASATTTPTTTTRSRPDRAGATFNCAAPVNNSPNNTGLTNLPPANRPTVDYDYSGNPLFPEIGGGGAPMGGPVYRYDADLDSDRKWPAYFDGKAIFGEWNQNKLYTFQVNADGTSLGRHQPAPVRPDRSCARWTASSARTARCT